MRWKRTVTVLKVVSVGLLLAAGCHGPIGNKTAVDRSLIGEVMMHSEFSRNLRALCMPGGRLSGSDNGHKAERYVAGKLREYGLDNVHLEPFDMLTWRDLETTVTVLDDPPYPIDGAISLGNCLSSPVEGITAELIYAGHGTEQELEEVASRLEGKFVLVKEGKGHRSEKMRLALEHGVAGVLQISAIEDLSRVGQCHPEPRQEPGVAIPGKSGGELIERLTAGETIRINVKIKADAWQSTPHNVVGEIPGHGPLAGEIVILGAHLDSWHLAEGAIDNGNGSATILETARAMAQLALEGWRPRRTVRFVWFMGEEHGLHGSRAYVEQHVAELDDIVTMVNVDMPGCPRSLSTFGHEEIIDLLMSIKKDLSGYELAEEIGIATWTASDHAPFMKQGVCAVTLSGHLGDGVRFYHSVGDTYEVVDRRGTIRSSVVLAVLVRRLADHPTRPARRYDPEAM